MASSDPSVKDCIRRALSASEIAHSSPDPQLRRSFLELCAAWLDRAERHGGQAPQGREPTAG